jgi:hypothetical protein
MHRRQRLSALSALAFLAVCPPALPAEDGCLFFASPQVPQSGAASPLFRLTPHRLLPPEVKLNPRRGSLVVRLAPRAPFGGFPAMVDVYPGPPHLSFRLSAAWPQVKDGEPPPPEPRRLRCGAQVVLRHALDGNALETMRGATDVEPGQDLHAVWTWSGVRHDLYLNGTLVASHIAASPFPSDIRPSLRLLSNYQADQVEAAGVRAIAGYDVALTPAQVLADRAGAADQPLAGAGPGQGPNLLAQWAPGERKAYVALDTGKALAGQAVRADLIVRRQADGLDTALATGSLALEADGFGETLLRLPAMPAGAYRVEAFLADTNGQRVGPTPPGALASEPWTLPETPWLGNTLGVTQRVQPPWTPVARDGLTLRVWGREYTLAGGFGLPQQVTSQGRALLARPVALELLCDGQALALAEPAVRITTVLPQVAGWRGSAVAGDVALSVRGRLEYDGMVLLQLTLAPRISGRPVRLDGIRLATTMPKERALFLNTATDQGYWWYPYKGWIPETPGVVHDNLRQRAAKTSFLFFALFFDHETGLEWFADNLAGWQVDERRPVQEIVRMPGGDVQLLCHLANQPFELREPLTITFGYDATPVKPLPPDWRATYVHHNPLPGVASDKAMWWLWSDNRYDKFRPNVFLLRPDDLEGFASLRQPGHQVHRVRLAPFTNQHVTIPAYPENQQPDKGWGWFNNLLGAESANDGWTAMPTRGIRDYWAWNLDAWLASGGLDAIYIDEANTKTVHASLLSGSGYRRPDGTHGYGHNTLGMREQLKRVRQLFLDHGKPLPAVWIPTYGMMIPHAFAFVDMVSEGEAFMFDKPEAPDWIDVWGADLLARTAGPGARGGPWLLALGPAQKFGFIPVFLNYIKFYDKPEYLPAMRAQYALLGLLDIIPVSPELGWFFKAKQDFGMSAPETVFRPFHAQAEVRAEREDVPISYYRRGDRLLLVVSNLGREPYTGRVSLRLEALGLAADGIVAADLLPVSETRAATAYREEPLRCTPAGGTATLELVVPPHDFRLLRVGPETAGTAAGVP